MRDCITIHSVSRQAFFMLAPQVQSVSVCLRCASRVRSIQCLGSDQMCNVTAHDLRDLAKWGAWMSYGSRSVQRCVSWVHADDKNIIPNPFFLSTETLGISNWALSNGMNMFFGKELWKNVKLKKKKKDSGSLSCLMTDLTMNRAGCHARRTLLLKLFWFASLDGFLLIANHWLKNNICENIVW